MASATGSVLVPFTIKNKYKIFIKSVIIEFYPPYKVNTKKDDLHLAKHMMHLIRLYLMCFDILENGEIITYRENDLELLHKIRSGYFLHNGQIDSSFMCMVDEYSNKLKDLASKTKLPDKPDIENVEKMRMYVNNMVVNEEIQGIEI